MEHKKQKSKVIELIRELKLYVSLLPFRRKKYLFLVGTPSHDNIGDLAIALAELQLIKDVGFSPVEITTKEIIKYFGVYKRILKNRVVILHGGGNMGDIWFGEEQIRRQIIKNIKAKRFIIMPQTIYYSSSCDGKEKEKQSVGYYNNAKNTLFLRKISR